LIDNYYPIKLKYSIRFAERSELEKKLEPWRNSDAHGKKRVKRVGSSFTIKYNHNSSFYAPSQMLNLFFCFRCVGVWDTVGSFGLPEELLMYSKNNGCPFGFPDRILGEHIERAYQALALNETRADFVSFYRTLKLFFYATLNNKVL
jgi:Uncharacterized alpha/beta hydrolase domain (DUF2235)